MKSQKLILIELNEINFDFVRAYVAQGKLPTLGALIARHGIIETTSEQDYDHLEPWIQWITAHTGKTYNEHGVFRLGDIVDHEIKQIWEYLEDNGVSVGAISPMNANNRTKNAAFFVPDPWTKTQVSGGLLLEKLSGAVAEAVNENAKSRVGLSSLFWLALAALRYARVANYRHYLSFARRSRGGKSWAKAQILEELLADVTITQTSAKTPQFVSLFLNAGAHIQHHYMFNAAVYAGEQQNPEWLIAKSDDPILDIYAQYDRILATIQAKLPTYRIMIATGLHQDPYPETKYYWRLRDHHAFLTMIDAPFTTVEPRMSRDFLVQCNTVDNALETQAILESATSSDGAILFEVDNRGNSLFVMLVYPHDIPTGMQIRVGQSIYPNFEKSVAFVAIKNGEHNGIGYLIDTGRDNAGEQTMALSQLPSRVAAAFGLQWPENITA
jgi:hypothetical protein